jgi:hypothetical protein
MISVKLHKSYRTIVAVCDSNIVGKKFEEPFSKGIKQLDIRENFYKNKELSYEEAVELMKFQSKEDATFNIVGTNSIKAAKEAGIITDEGIATIDNIPYALVLL